MSSRLGQKRVQKMGSKNNRLHRFLVGGVFLVAIGLGLLVVSPGCGGGAPADEPKVIVLGIDGLDHELMTRLISEGQLPNFKRLADQGSFTPLETTVPPQSPVAWSSFIIGGHPGMHGIFDFVHRNPKTMQPYLSTSQAEPPGDFVTVGKYQFPLKSGKTNLLRHGKAFWEVLEEAGYPTVIMRMPANYPPTGNATRELSGMGTPDIHGSYGLFSFFTTDPLAFTGDNVSGGRIYHVAMNNNTVTAHLEGPKNDLLVEGGKLKTEFKIHLDPEANAARLVVGDEERVLSVGEWTDWVPVEFELAPTQSLHAMGRFLLKSVTPELGMYVSPLNFDPLNLDAVISTPESFATELAEEGGRFYTQGMPEDTSAFSAGVLETDEFLQQTKITSDEIIDQYTKLLDEFDRGLFFNYFGDQDLVGHMMWRAMDPEHPAYDEEIDGPYKDTVINIYKEFDKLVGRTLDTIDDNTLLVVMSDHGFASWRRVFDLNTWLKEQGYLALRPGREKSGPVFSGVDWSRTRAYGIGINGLYINLAGREKNGVVMPHEHADLVREIRDKLLAEVDPKSGERSITKVYLREEVYPGTPYPDIAPDLVVGYAKMTRGSNASALGEVGTVVYSDNMDRWCGDHLMDHEAVPGVLMTNRPLKKRADKLVNLAAALLAEFGIDEFPVAREE